ncbi:MAG: SNF2 helicase-associated domain-containing protein [Thermodesulfobacteriota bacterium]|nr:SNF2 helicase-associated domain-containing protein [Thermodesulfobacteriota bacterium]
MFHPLAWTLKEAFSFLKEIPVYEESGILCRIPNLWKGSSSGMRLNIDIGDNAPSFVGKEAILQFDTRFISWGHVDFKGGCKKIIG